MKQLCQRHRHMFTSLSLSEQNNLWMFWMESACTFSETNNTDKMIAATGRAFNLARLARQHYPDCMHVELTLSTILVCHALQNRGDYAAADHALVNALESLRSARPCYKSARNCCSTQDCIDVLLDTSRQPRFFDDYLSWPGFPPAPPANQPLMAIH